MTLLDMIIKEYISIVKMLETKKEVENDRIIIGRDEFKGILERYAFTTFTQKTKAYKDLNFIICNNNSYTIPYKDKDLGKTVRKVIINYKTYKTVRDLYNTAVN